MSNAIAPMHDMLSQMRSMAQVAGMAPSAQGVSGPAAGGFAAELGKAIESVSQAQLNSIQKQQDFALGKPGVELNDVMIDMQKASIGFQSAVQVRNKLVTAYQTIASMPL